MAGTGHQRCCVVRVINFHEICTSQVRVMYYVNVYVCICAHPG